MQSSSCFFQHEDLSLRMFEHLMDSNDLNSAFGQYGLTEIDRTFIKEQIGPQKPRSGVRTLYFILNYRLQQPVLFCHFMIYSKIKCLKIHLAYSDIENLQQSQRQRNNIDIHMSRLIRKLVVFCFPSKSYIFPILY